MQLNLIGRFEIVTDDGREYTINAPKISRMLALLALQPRGVVATDLLIQELWGENPPRGALRTLQTHVYHARKLLMEEKVTEPDRDLLVTRAPGYELQVDDDEVDTISFERLIQRAQWELTAGRVERADEQVSRALGMWRGPVLSNVPVGCVLAGRVARVEELRIRALELHIETGTLLGRHRELLPDLRTLVHDYPLHEWFHGQLISALHQVGRRGEALQAYQDLYQILSTELGLQPSDDVQRLQAEILNGAGSEMFLRRPRPDDFGHGPVAASLSA
ncbi:AfsR/SARP family transcriptional regulator [Streptomyces johnsoniae]|uniref:AfsR/SARP family transcriptional regulator n=1 Tax=Streptomyces johnsoniae TaxID=3075532 RepID=A0ABU2SBZ0_9ACTN|nr:AfsR/SARP family transcriptional regulator [Streptomyces sp. DSM 41886]MDT0446496.1 AfsR/SARP family transcriptional regulator [Streptomyces sp. DSM 41886]